MLKYRAISTIIVLFLTQYSFAMDASKDPDDMSFKQCGTIAKACKKAGYSGKKFWMDCMKPVLLNETVKGVKLDESDVKACRDFKIAKMEKELQQFKDIK